MQTRDHSPQHGPRGFSGPRLFAVMYFIYFGFGSINFVPRRGVVGLNTVLLWLAGLAAFGLGVWCRDLLRTDLGGRYARPGERQRQAARTLSDVVGWRTTAQLLGVVGIFAALGIFAKFGGIPLFSGERRNEISPIFVGLLPAAYLAAAITSAYALFKRHWSLLLWCLMGVASLLLLGYRTFVLIPAGTIFFTALNLGLIRLQLRWWAVGGVLAFAFAWLGFYRFDAGKDAILRQFLVLGLPDEYAPFVPLWATPREGTSVFALLVEKCPETWDFQHGRLLLSAFLAALPGKQLGPRLEIAAWIGGRRGQSITPSILGQPYVDFGVIGVITFMFVVGLALKSMWLWQEPSLTWAPKVASAYVLTILIIDIHAGILDAQFIGSSLFILWWARRAENRSKVSGRPRNFAGTRF